MSNDLVKIGHQIYDFLAATGRTHLHEIPIAVGHTLEYIIENYPTPDRQPVPESSRRSRTSSQEPPTFPYNWSTDLPTFRRVVKAFGDRTYNFRNEPEVRQYIRLQDPPSTGATPSHSPTGHPPTSRSATSDPEASGASVGTSATSAEETEEETRRRTPTPTPLPEMAANFSEAQRNEMAGIIAQAIAIANQNAPQAPRQPDRPPQFRPRDIGYFDPDPQAAPVEVKETHNVYHNVFSFTNRLRVKATTMDPIMLRQNVESCLLGAADDWYTNQLTHISRVGLRNDPDGVKEWCDALEARFRDSPGKSLTLLESVRYTVRDARNKRDPADYVSSIVLNSKNAGIATTEAAQVLLAYEHIDGELRRDLPRPTEASTVSSLLDELRHQKDIWFDIYGGKSYETRPLTTPQNRQDRRPQGQATAAKPTDSWRSSAAADHQRKRKRVTFWEPSTTAAKSTKRQQLR